mgnify:CR=1 FL=1
MGLDACPFSALRLDSWPSYSDLESTFTDMLSDPWPFSILLCTFGDTFIPCQRSHRWLDNLLPCLMRPTASYMSLWETQVNRNGKRARSYLTNMRYVDGLYGHKNPLQFHLYVKNLVASLLQWSNRSLVCELVISNLNQTRLMCWSLQRLTADCPQQH